MFWKPHKKLSEAFKGNKTVRTNGKPFGLALWNVARICAFLSVQLETSQIWSSVYVSRVNGALVILWKKALMEKSNGVRTSDSQPSRA